VSNARDDSARSAIFDDIRMILDQQNRSIEERMQSAMLHQLQTFFSTLPSATINNSLNNPNTDETNNTNAEISITSSSRIINPHAVVPAAEIINNTVEITNNIIETPNIVKTRASEAHVGSANSEVVDDKGTSQVTSPTNNSQINNSNFQYHRFQF